MQNVIYKFTPGRRRPIIQSASSATRLITTHPDDDDHRASDVRELGREQQQERGVTAGTSGGNESSHTFDSMQHLGHGDTKES